MKGVNDTIMHVLPAGPKPERTTISPASWRSRLHHVCILRVLLNGARKHCQLLPNCINLESSLQEIEDIRQLVDCHQSASDFCHGGAIGNIFFSGRSTSEYFQSVLESRIGFMKNRAAQYELDAQYKDAENIRSQILTLNWHREPHVSAEDDDGDISALVSLYKKMGNFTAAQALQELFVRRLTDRITLGLTDDLISLSSEIETLASLYHLFIERVIALQMQGETFYPFIDTTQLSHECYMLARMQNFQRATKLDISQLNSVLAHRNLLGICDISLHIAVQGRAVNMTRMLLDRKKLPVNIRDCNGASPLHIAAQNGDSLISEMLLDSKADVGAVSNDQRTPLHLASQKEGAEGIVLMLLSAGADTMVVDKDGHTAVYLAAKAGRMETIELLLRHDSQHWSTQETVLHLATKMGLTPIVQLLLDAWRSASIPTDFHSNRTSAKEVMRRTEWHIQRVMLEARDELGHTALHVALLGRSRSHQAVFRLLIESGADIEARDKYGRTVLHLAASQKDKGFVQALLDMNASHEARDRWGCTPLHAAAASRAGSTVVSLLLSGADKEAKDSVGMTPLIRATCGGCTNEDRNCGVGSATAQASMKKDGCGDENYAHIVYSLLDEGANPNSKDCQGRAALYYAVDKGFCMITKHLLQAGAKIETTDEVGRTALHRAAAKGHDEIVKILLTKPVDIDARDDRGQTALMLAAQSVTSNPIPVSQTLLTAGASVKLKGCNGATVFDIAKSRKQTALVKLLLQYK